MSSKLSDIGELENSNPKAYAMMIAAVSSVGDGAAIGDTEINNAITHIQTLTAGQS